MLVSPPSVGRAPTRCPGSSANRRPQCRRRRCRRCSITRRVADLLLTTAEQPSIGQRSPRQSTRSAGRNRSRTANGGAVSGEIALRRRRGAGAKRHRNVIPGTGPRANEFVVIGAHYDHLGTGQLGHIRWGRPGQIFHGADDNASGTAAVLETVDRLRQRPAAAAIGPRRAVHRRRGRNDRLGRGS